MIEVCLLAAFAALVVGVHGFCLFFALHSIRRENKSRAELLKEARELQAVCRS